MPFRNYQQFDKKTLDLMREAYDACMVRLGLKSDNPQTSTLAATIATLADEGERDVGALTEKAIALLVSPGKKKR